jgi:pimeloyl-ACP methyl ester carboxylesterase
MRPHQLLRLRGRGVDLAADAYGDPGQPPVLLLHGGGQTRHAWGSTCTALATSGMYAVALDSRGHGDSGWAPDGDYSMEAFVADIAAVVATFDSPPAIVGASMGGLTALVAEGEEPRDIASALVLVDVAPRLELEGILRIIGFMSARPEGFAAVDEAADAIAEYLPHRPRPSDLRGLAKNLRQGDDGRYRWHWDPAFLSGPKRLTASGDPDRLLRAAEALDVPTLLVRGRLSDLVSEEGVSEFLGAVPHAEFVDVSDAGHMVAGDRNDAFTSAVVDFVTRVMPGLPT